MRISNVQIDVVFGSACDVPCDVLVNAANTAHVGGGGIDGEIHRRCGSELMYELAEKAPEGAGIAVPVVTHAYGELSNVRWIVHVAGPIWDGTNKILKYSQLEMCYSACMNEVFKLKAKSIVFPSISTGIYSFPLELAAEIALSTVINKIELYSCLQCGHSLEHVTFAMFRQHEYDAFFEQINYLEKRGGG